MPSFDLLSRGRGWCCKRRRKVESLVRHFDTQVNFDSSELIERIRAFRDLINIYILSMRRNNYSTWFHCFEEMVHM